jgi:hypothetical protein
MSLGPSAVQATRGLEEPEVAVKVRRDFLPHQAWKGAVADSNPQLNLGLKGPPIKRLSFVLAAALLTASTLFVAAQDTVSRSVTGRPDTDVQIGVYVNVKPDCTTGPLPSIQLISPPENGKVTVKQARVVATNYNECLAVEVPAFVAFYHSKPDFSGVDVLTVQVKYFGGKTELQKISVTVTTKATPGQGL